MGLDLGTAPLGAVDLAVEPKFGGWTDKIGICHGTANTRGNLL